MQKNLVITAEKARSLYPSASHDFKTVLETTFGKDFFNVPITERVKSVEDAYEVLGIERKIPEGLQPDEVAYLDLKAVVKALNEGWTPDWDNPRQYKYYPWFYLNQPGFRLVVVYVFNANSDVGSRLCFKSEALAKYAADQFLQLYKVFFTA